VYETVTHDIHNLQKRLMQTYFDFNPDTTDAGVTILDHVCVLVVDTLNTCGDMNVHLCESPEHF